MRTFGAIFQYAGEAMQSHEKWLASQRRGAENARAEADLQQSELDEHQRAEERFYRLSEDEHKALYARVKEELFQRHADVIRRFDEAALDSTIKAGMLKILRDEPEVNS